MVRKNQRQHTEFDVLNTALDMTSYTLNIISNEHHFDKKYQKVIDRISEEATAIYHMARVANTIRVMDNFTASERLRLQKESEIECQKLTSDIMISHKLFHLRLRQVNVWSSKVEETEKQIHKWSLSDKERYKEWL